MKEHPILFSGPMVRAILDGLKTQTRRVIKPQPVPELGYRDCPTGRWLLRGAPLDYARAPWSVGDRLWVRETWAAWYGGDVGGAVGVVEPEGTVGIAYCADSSRRRVLARDWNSLRGSRVLAGCEDALRRWRPSIHMPRWASRTTLVVTDVRAELLQSITPADVLAEGVRVAEGVRLGPYRVHNPAELVTQFRVLWDSLNAKRGFGWVVNPWVRVVTFQPAGGAE